MENERLTAKNSSIDVLCALSLFLLFSISSLILISIGATNYKGILGETNKSFNLNSSLNYITNKLHNYDQTGLVAIIDFEGTEMLELSEDAKSSGYHTLIYFHEGYIYELLISRQLSFKLGDGEKILPVASLDFEMNGNIITVSASDDNLAEMTSIICLKSRTEKGAQSNAQD